MFVDSNSADQTLTIGGPVQIGSVDGPKLTEATERGTNHELIIDKMVITENGIQIGSVTGPKITNDSSNNVTFNKPIKIGGGPVIDNDQSNLLIYGPVKIGNIAGPVLDIDSSNNLTISKPVKINGGPLISASSGFLTVDNAISLGVGTNKTIIDSYNMDFTQTTNKYGLRAEHGIGIEPPGDEPGGQFIAIRNKSDSNTKLSIYPGTIELEHKTGSTDDSQTITPTMTASASGKAAGAGIEFSGDAQFNVPSGSGSVKVRISDLYDPDANIAYLTNVVSALCRKIYTYTNGGTAPTKDPSTGEITVNDYGPIQNDLGWIQYFATRNLDNGTAPPVNPSSN